MSLNAALSIASSGLAAVNKQLTMVSHNVANAGTPGYAVETLPQTSLTANGVAMGVVTGVAQRQVDAQLDTELARQGGTVAGLQVISTALSAIDAAQGTPGAGTDLASLQGTLQNAFSALGSDPSNQTAQQQVVTDAQGLASGISNLAGAYATERQSAQDAIVTGVWQLNTQLASIGSLSSRIVVARAAGASSADLENQRDQAIQQVTQLVDVSFVPQGNGDMLAVTQSGLSINLHGATAPFATSDATLGPASTYPGSIPPITLGGVDVTTQLTGGQIGANLQLRDATLPTFQGELDEYSHTLATRFQSQGLTLFTDPSGAVPSGGTPAQSGYVGFSATIQVNPAVVSNPALVRDGTTSVSGTNPGDGSAFTPNPGTGPSGYTGLITRVLDYTFGANAQSGVAQPTPAQTGLGPNGNLSAPYSGTTLSSLVTAMVASQSQACSTAQSRLTTEQAVQTTLQGKVADASGVSIDSEMSTMIQLQNAYAANAHVLTAVQSMWQTLVSAVS